MIQFDYCNIFERGWNHQLVIVLYPSYHIAKLAIPTPYTKTYPDCMPHYLATWHDSTNGWIVGILGIHPCSDPFHFRGSQESKPPTQTTNYQKLRTCPVLWHPSASLDSSQWGQHSRCWTVGFILLGSYEVDEFSKKRPDTVHVCRFFFCQSEFPRGIQNPRIFFRQYMYMQVVVYTVSWVNIYIYTLPTTFYQNSSFSDPLIQPPRVLGTSNGTSK